MINPTIFYTNDCEFEVHDATYLESYPNAVVTQIDVRLQKFIHMAIYQHTKFMIMFENVHLNIFTPATLKCPLLDQIFISPIFFGPFSDLPTYTYPILAQCYDYFSIAISDF